MSDETTKSDDERRFTEIFESCHDHVLAYARRRVGDDVAQDVVADAFLAAWRNLDRIPSTPLPWLFRATAFEIGHARRKLDQDRRLGDAVSVERAGGSDPADEVARGDEWISALRRLNPRDREVLCLAAWEEVSPADGAFVLRCSVATYKVRLHRARRRLIRLVEVPTGPHRSAEIISGFPASLPQLVDADQVPLIADAKQTIVQRECS